MITTKNISSNQLSRALQYAGYGWPVLPLYGITKDGHCACITGTVDQELLLLRNEYLAAENRVLRGQLKGRLKLSDAERAKLGEIGRRLGRKVGQDTCPLHESPPICPPIRKGLH
jgi:hypothetical protein